MGIGKITPRELAGYIDHTFLKQESPSPVLGQFCAKAMHYGFASVCVHPCNILRTAEVLRGSSVKVCSVVGFPMGMVHSKIKEAEAALAIEEGAQELDMVVNLGAVLQGDLKYVEHDIRPIVRLCRQVEPHVTLKVIIESAVLERRAKIALCEQLSDLGVDFIKTSTGLHPAGGATIEDIQLLCQHRGHCRVKAAGGIRDLQTTLAMLQTGAERVGTSTGVAIMEELLSKGIES